MTDARILLAEDDRSLRDILAIFLETRGCEVISVGDGAQALLELGRQPFDLLITDLMMPGMSGAELLSSLRDNPPEHVPAVILMTGKGTVENALDIMKSGVSAFLRKPLNLDELEVAVATAIDRNRLDRRLKRYYSELDMKVEARTRELTLLNRFSSVVNSSFDIDVIMKDAVEYLCECLRADASWIYMLDEGSGLLRLKASKGFPDEFKDKLGTLDASRGYSGRTFREGGAFIYNELPQTGVPIAGPVAAHGFGSAVHAAIKSAENVLGSMGVASRSGHEFQESDLQLLTSFGNQIGVAVEKIRLYERERAAARDLHKKVNEHVILNEMGNMLRVSIDLELAARAVVSTIAQGLGFERVCLWLLSDDSSGLSLKAGKGVAEGFMGASLKAGKEALTSFMFDTDGNPRFGDPVCSMVETDLKKPLPGHGPVAVVPLMTRIPESRGVNCWEHFGCREGHCPAFANPLACWMVDESCVRKFRESATLLEKIGVCNSCEVYRKNMKGECIGVICVETQGKALDDDDMKTLGVFANTAAAALENIKLMERMVKSERFIENIMANMASGLLVTDMDGRVKMINSVGADILNVDQSGIKGRSIVEMLPEAARLITVDNDPAGHEVTVKTKDGPVPVGYSNSYMKERGGGPDGVIVVFRDLSDIKRLHERLREGDRFAAIGKVAAGVAHEIRNPLFGITSVAQILGRETDEDSPHKALIDAMLSETSRLNTLVEELLLYGRSTRISPVATDLKALLEDVLEFHGPAIDEKGISIVREFDESTPLALVDPHQMRQIFLNLLFNALDATPKGGIIRIATSSTPGGAVVRIMDNGVGISRDELPRVFDLFFTTKEKGTGLGLAICRKIIEDHGGTVSIRSSQGEGTEVELVIPVNNQ